MKKLFELIEKYPELTVNIKLSDLVEANRILITETKESLEKHIEEANQETYPSVDEVTELLGVSKTTLWRWAKRDYLVPIEVGGKRRYKMSEVKALLDHRTEKEDKVPLY